MSTTGQSSQSKAQNILPIQSSYPTVLYIICPILILYFGVYVMLRNHYIFKPMIKVFLKKMRIKSSFIKEVITDLLSSLAILTFALNSFVLSDTDQALQLVVHHDMYWAGLCMSVLAYRNVKEEEVLEMKVVMKNGIFLIACYLLITYQYFSNYSFLLMGLVLMAIYIVNVFFKVYEQKFITMIEILFDNKPLEIGDVQYNHVNKLQSPEYLATNFPVSRQEIEQKLSVYEPSLRRLKLKTKVSVTKKLLILSLAVRISQQKMIAKMKREVVAYYGGLNGTTNEKVKRLEYDIKNSLIEDNVQRQGTLETLEEDPIINIIDVDDELEVLFTIFPIRVFQSSIIISVIFTFFLNLSFGLCLDYTMSITSTLSYGEYMNNLYGLLILPVLPNVSKTEYFNSMALFSLWKYFLIGFFVCISLIVNGSVQVSKILQIETILVGVMVIFAMGYLLSGSKNEYKLFIAFFLIFAVNLGITYSSGNVSDVSS